MPSIDAILRPLARLAIRKGWLFRDVEKRLKRAYVDAAQDLADGTVTDSKISIMTGLQRRDIAALRAEQDVPPNRQPLAEIIALWWSDPDYPTEALPTQKADRSFATLARQVRQDVHPRTFLDLLIECGAVTEDGDTVTLKTRHYRPLAGSEEQLAYLGDNVGDHLSTAVANVIDAKRNYDMAVHYTGLSASAIAKLDTLYRARLNGVLDEIDTRARALPASDDGPYRFRAGGYFFDDKPERSASDEP